LGCNAFLNGIISWLVVEGLFSAYLGVWFNVGVDIAILALFIFPLERAISSENKKK
jgi:ABC-type multidrug transport system permease subunit